MAQSYYDTHVKPYFAEIEKWMQEELIPDFAIAKRLGITRERICVYKKKHPEFAELLLKGKQDFTFTAYKSLGKRVTGYNHTEVKTVTKVDAKGNETVTTEEVQKHVMPDVGAIALYLKSRKALGSWDEDLKEQQTKKLREEIKIMETTGQMPQNSEVSKMIDLLQTAVKMESEDDESTK